MRLNINELRENYKERKQVKEILSEENRNFW